MVASTKRAAGKAGRNKCALRYIGRWKWLWADKLDTEGSAKGVADSWQNIPQPLQYPAKSKEPSPSYFRLCTPHDLWAMTFGPPSSLTPWHRSSHRRHCLLHWMEICHSQNVFEWLRLFSILKSTFCLNSRGYERSCGTLSLLRIFL